MGFHVRPNLLTVAGAGTLGPSLDLSSAGAAQQFIGIRAEYLRIRVVYIPRLASVMHGGDLPLSESRPRLVPS